MSPASFPLNLRLGHNRFAILVNTMKSEYIPDEFNINRDHVHGLPLSRA